jgi:hypothetical protein
MAYISLRDMRNALGKSKADSEDSTFHAFPAFATIPGYKISLLRVNLYTG